MFFHTQLLQGPSNQKKGVPPFARNEETSRDQGLTADKSEKYLLRKQMRKTNLEARKSGNKPKKHACFLDSWFPDFFANRDDFACLVGNQPGSRYRLRLRFINSLLPV